MNEKIKGSLECFKETKEILEKFSSKEEAVEFLVNETGVSRNECLEAYDFLIKLNLNKEIKWETFYEKED